MTIYRNRLQDIEIDRNLLIYIENERGKGRDKWKGIERSRETSASISPSISINLSIHISIYRDNRDGERKRD